MDGSIVLQKPVSLLYHPVIGAHTILWVNVKHQIGEKSWKKELLFGKQVCPIHPVCEVK